MFVHHEDLRRAQTGWEPRELDASTTAAVRRRIPMISRVGLSKSMAALPARLTLRTPDGQTVVAVQRNVSVQARQDAPRWRACPTRRDTLQRRYERADAAAGGRPRGDDSGA